VYAQSQLENPAPNSFQSGQGIISGWHCQATTIEIVVDGTIRVQAPYGTLRGDTQAACGDVNNGFGFQVNWNELGDGTHTVVVLADGTQFGQATFSVKTLGVPYLSGASGSYRLQGFAGKDVTIQWSEALQNFVIVDAQNAPEECDPAYPTVCIPSPPPDLNCADIPYRNFVVRPPDPHRFARDNDGSGCEE
jgi:hypothetical protein